MKYQIQVHAQNSWNTNGTPIIERDCGHNHTTLTGAYRCFAKLTKRNSDGSYALAWYHAFICLTDGTALSCEEQDVITRLKYEDNR